MINSITMTNPVTEIILQAPDHPLRGLLVQAEAQAGVGGMAPAATEAQKWATGDLIHQMQTVVARARDQILDPLVSVTPQTRAQFRSVAADYDRFLDTQGLTRGTLLASAVAASVFPAGHPMRLGPLTFSHARTLSRIGGAGEREAWAARTEREGLSVGRLQALINTAGRGGAGTEDANSASESAVEEGQVIEDGQAIGKGQAPVAARGRARKARRPSHLYLCALTGEPLGDLASMVELRVHLDGAGEASLAEGCVRPLRRGGAARMGTDGLPVAFPVLLRFASLAALSLWLAARAENLANELETNEIETNEIETNEIETNEIDTVDETR